MNKLILMLCFIQVSLLNAQNVSIKTNPFLLLNKQITLSTDIALNQKSSIELQLEAASTDLDRIETKNRKNIQVRYKRDLFSNEKNFNGLYVAGVIEAGHLKWGDSPENQYYYGGGFVDTGYQFTWKRLHMDSFIGLGFVTADSEAFEDPDCNFCGLNALQDMYFIGEIPLRVGLRMGYVL